MADRDALTNPPRRLPALALPSRGGGTVPLNPPGRTSPVLLLLHDRCAECAEYVGGLAGQADAIAEWDGRVLAVFAGGGDAGAFASAADAEGRVAAAAGVAAPAVVIADQWGEIHAAEAAGEGHAFMAPAEVVQWLQYLAVQCPECQGEAY